MKVASKALSASVRAWKTLLHDLAFAQRSTTVFLGFAGLLLLMGAVVVDSEHQARHVTLDSDRVRKEYIERDALLDDLRTDIYHASTLTRDYLSTPDKSGGASVAPVLKDIRIRIDAILRRYGQLVLPSERESLQTVSARLNAYLDTLDAAILATADERQASSPDIVLPHRGELLALLAQVNAMNRRDTTEGEERIQTLHAQFQRRVEVISFLASLISGILAIIVVSRHQYLERKAAAHLDEVQAARQDLRFLSDRLLTAQEEERRNISRELHDQVGQSMTAMLMDLSRLESRLSRADPCNEIVSSIRRSAEENVARVRDLALLLRPSMLDELGLVAALDWQVREIARRSGLKVKLISDEIDEELPENVRICVYRIVQESLHNCVKHSRASEARVILHRDQDALLVSVQDDGAGFDVKRQRGLGLLGIEERAVRLGGRSSVESYPGGGAIVSVRLPLSISGPRELVQDVA